MRGPKARTSDTTHAHAWTHRHTDTHTCTHPQKPHMLTRTHTLTPVSCDEDPREHLQRKGHNHPSGPPLPHPCAPPKGPRGQPQACGTPDTAGGEAVLVSLEGRRPGRQGLWKPRMPPFPPLPCPPPEPCSGASPAQTLTDQRPGSGTLPQRCCRAAALWGQKRP